MTEQKKPAAKKADKAKKTPSPKPAAKPVSKTASSKKVEKPAAKKPVKGEEAEEAPEEERKIKEKKQYKRVRKQSPKRPKAVRARALQVAGKPRMPVFRGRWGKRNFRKVRDKKWDKWHRPRGIDIVRKREDGRVVDAGYGVPAEVRHLHPSGYKEARVHNVADLERLAENKDTTAARIAGTVGLAKRNAIVEKANKLGVRVLN